MEMRAVSEVLLPLGTRRAQRFMVASSKANFGHGECSAGMVGMQRLMLQLGVQLVGPNALLRVLNPHLDLDGRACCLTTQVAPLVSSQDTTGVSSFGYSGTIVHTLLRGTDTRARSNEVAKLKYRRREYGWVEPSHPFAQVRRRSKAGDTIWRSPIAGALHAIVADHVVQGRTIFPGAGYLEVMAMFCILASPSCHASAGFLFHRSDRLTTFAACPFGRSPVLLLLAIRQRLR
jgi:hypothetical protein